jgi:hypothetical protein
MYLINTAFQSLVYSQPELISFHYRQILLFSVLGYHRLKFNKPWFDDECSKLIDQWKQAKLQWLQNPSQINGHNLQNLRHEVSKTFRTRKENI